MSALDKISTARERAYTGTVARERLAMLFDADTFVEVGGFVRTDGAPSGVVCGFGAVAGGPVYAFAQDGAVGKAHADKVKKLFDMALKTGVPVIGLYDSKGVRVSEGAGCLAAAADLLACVGSLSGVVPQISVILGSCVGTNALAALSADFVIMSEKADFYETPVSAATSSGAGTAKAALESGVAHILAKDDADALEKAKRLISMLPINNLAAAPVAAYDEPAGAAETLRAAAKAEDIVAALADSGSAVELFSGFGDGVYAAMATMAGFSCGVLATRGGALSGDDCAKMARLVSVWDAFQLPILTLVDSTGMKGSADAFCPNARDMARLVHLYNEATTAKLSVVTGKAYGAAFAALACNMDYVLAWPSAVISPLSPAATIAFRYSDRITAEVSREQVEADYIANEASPLTAAENGYLDDVIDPAVTRPALLAALDLLSAKRVHKNPKKHSNIPL